MAHLRFQVAIYHPTMLVIDHIVNTFYLNAPGFFDLAFTESTSADEQALANDTAALFASYRPYPSDISKVTVKCYAMEDAKPRPIRAQATADVVTQTSQPSGPREVALCLSYFSQLNRPRSRGRMFIGPFDDNAMRIRPSETHRGYLITLANGIANLGGIDIDWNVHSPTDNDYKKVSDSWVDDEWDTVRSRGLRATTRTTATHNE